MDEMSAHDLSKSDRDDLEARGMTPRAIDDAVAELRLRGGAFSAQDVLDIGPIRSKPTDAPRLLLTDTE